MGRGAIGKHHLFELLTCNGGVKGQSPLRSFLCKGDILSRERISPTAPLQDTTPKEKLAKNFKNHLQTPFSVL